MSDRHSSRFRRAVSRLNPFHSKPDVVQPHGHADPDANVSHLAYHQAWSGLREDEQANLSREASIKTLFEKLDETDQEHQSETLLKRGKMSLGLGYVSTICDYINLVTSWIPVPGLDASVSLLKGIIAIAVGICGAYDGLTNHIRDFLDQIPVIERCSNVTWSSNKESTAIRDVRSPALRDCYKILLSFYSKVMAFLLEESRIRRMLETFRSEIPQLVTDFKAQADKLSKLMEVETLVMVTKIWNKNVDDFVKANLYTRSQHYIASCNAATATRSDEACQWIIVEEAFEDWAYGAPGVLTMYGVAGCGKTAIASYVAEYLSTESKSPVLVSYCTEQATDKERHILCSLTYQLLQSEVELKAKFQEWSGARQAELREPPSNKPEKLWPFLGEALQDSKIQVFIVLDGLDECARDVRCRLLTRFRDLIRRGASLKVFLSSRQRNDILETLDGSAATIKNSPTEQPGSQIPLFHIDMKPNEERDRLLAKHLVSLHMAQDLEDKTRDLVIEQLTKGAGGSAIWLKMAMASLANDVTSAKNEYGVMRCLEFLQTSPKLVDWYQRLLSRVEDLEYHWINDLERALETLAVAKRPLTIGELSHAVLIDGDADDNDGSDNDEDDNDRDSPSLLNKAAKSADLLDNLLDVLRPFVVSLDDSFGETKNISVRLVHASLRDLLLAARPSQWKGIVAEARPRRLTKKELKQRIHELNGLLMGKCVKYLLLRDAEAKFPSEETYKPSDCESQDAQGDDKAGSEFGIDAMFVEPEVQKRVQAHALVSHLPFYDYAASHWAVHFAASGNSVQAELRDSARALLDVSTNDCIQWVSFVRAEKEATAEAFPSSSEAATLAAYYGLTVALSDILAEKSVLQSTKDEAILWASHQGHDRVVKLLLQNDADATKSKLDGRTALTVAAHRGHVDCVRALLADQRTDANVKDSNGRTALWLAANSGHEQICTILLNREDCRPDAQDRRQQTPLFGAIGAGHLSIIRLLAAHPGVNVNHKDKAGRTALSCAAGFGDIISLTQLLNVKDVDVNLPDKDGKSPLIWAASKGQAACVDALLQNGNTDKTASNHCKDGKNAYHYACHTGTPGEHAALLCLLKHDLPGRDDPDSAGWTPLMWAVGSGPVAFTRTLLAAGQVELERRDHNGRTALSLAAEWGSPSVDIVEVLLRHGANPETKDNEGKTPWDFATKKERFVIASRISSWINKQ